MSRPTGRVADLVAHCLALLRKVASAVVAVLMFAAIAALGVMGAIYQDDATSTFFMDREGVLPAHFSALLLLSAGALAMLAERSILARGLPRGTWVLLGLFFVFMGVDEWRVVHERLEGATGIDWELLYLPLALPGAVAWLFVVRALWRRHARAGALFCAGALAWLAAQALEAYQWGAGDVLVHPGTIIPEEMLEMGGSALFVLAVLVALRALREERRLIPTQT